MRIRVPELLEERGWTAYELAKRSGKRISLSTAYRISQLRGEVKCFDAGLLEALCDTFGVGPADVLERSSRARGALPSKRRSAKRG